MPIETSHLLFSRIFTFTTPQIFSSAQPTASLHCSRFRSVELFRQTKLPEPAGCRPELSGIIDRSLVFLLWAFFVFHYLNLTSTPLSNLHLYNSQISPFAQLTPSLYREEPAQDFCAHPNLIQPEYSSTPTTFFLFDSTNLSIPQCTEPPLTSKRTYTFSLRRF